MRTVELKQYRFSGNNREGEWMAGFQQGEGIRSVCRELKRQGFTGRVTLDTDNGIVERWVK